MSIESIVLSFDEIKDHSQFEDLVVSYFEGLKKDAGNNISNIMIKPSGVGVDGGRDILVTVSVHDGLVSFERTWVVQCKFFNSSISTDKISDINIPSLIHAYGAVGYLLVCKKKPTSKLTDFLEKLETNCKFNYKYSCWYGEPFLNRISLCDQSLHKTYFPRYSQFVEQQKEKLK